MLASNDSSGDRESPDEDSSPGGFPPLDEYLGPGIHHPISTKRARVSICGICLRSVLDKRSLNMACLDIESMLAFLKELFQDFRRFSDKRHAMFFFNIFPRRCQEPRKARAMKPGLGVEYDSTHRICLRSVLDKRSLNMVCLDI